MKSTTASPSMIGRQGDLDALHAEFAQALAGRPRVVVVAGEAGIGKTRLVTEFAAQASAEARVLIGKCVDLGADTAPYAPFTAVLRGLVEALGGADEGRARVQQVAGPGQFVLRALLPELTTSEPVEEHAGAERLYELVAVLLETFSRERPLVIVIEDIHWADTATIELIRFLVRMLASSRVLIVMTYRSDEVPRGHPLRAQLPELERTRRLVRWDLKRLTRAEVGRQASAILGKPLDAAALNGIYTRSEGVPFFVEELVSMDGEAGQQLPDTLRELLLARYERLSEPTQRMLRMLAAGGSCVEHGLLSMVFDGDASALDDAAREAIRANLLTVTDTEYSFRHALVWEAIHDDLLPGERTRFHSRYAAALEATPENCATFRSSVSYHWMMAHDLTRAFSSTLDAMRDARAGYAYATAARMGERALELWDQVPDVETLAHRDHVELLRQTASNLRHAGEGERALALVNLALEECARTDVEVFAGLMRDKALYLAWLSRPGSTVILEEALALVDGHQESIVRSQVLADLSGRLMLEARFSEAIETVTRALDAATQVQSAKRMSIAHTIRGVSLVGRGEIDAGLSDLARARELGETDDGAMLRYRVNASDIMFLLGRFADAISLGEEGARRAREIGVERTSGAMLLSNTVEALLAVGDWERAEALLGPALALDAPPGFRVHLQRMRLWLSLWRGELDTAVELMRSWRPGMLVQAEIEMQSRLGVARIEAEIALARNDLEQARNAVSVLLAPVHRGMSGYDLPLAVVAARVLARMRGTGRYSASELTATETAFRALVEQSESWRTAPVWIPLFDAELAGEDGRGTDLKSWQCAVSAVSRPIAPAHLRPYALFRLAQAHLEAGDRRAAENALCTARTGADALGAGLIVGWIDALAARAGLSLGDAEDVVAGSASDGRDVHSVRLTDREQQVLALIGQGLSNKQIGAQLFISAKTASVHVSAILRKLGATTRTEAVYLAQHAGDNVGAA